MIFPDRFCMSLFSPVFQKSLSNSSPCLLYVALRAHCAVKSIDVANAHASLWTGLHAKALKLTPLHCQCV